MPKQLVAALALIALALLPSTLFASEAELREAYTAYQQAAEAGDLRAALPHAERAYELGREQYGPDSRNTGLLAFNLGFIQNELLAYEAAVTVLSQSRIAHEQSEQAGDPELFDTLIELGRAQLGIYNSVSAYETLDTALSIAQTIHGSTSLQAGQAHYLMSFAPLFYETDDQPSVFRMESIRLDRSALAAMNAKWAPVGSNIHPRPRWSPSLDFEANQFDEIGEEHLSAAVAIFEGVEGNGAALASARLLRAAYEFRNGGRREADRMYQQAMDDLIDARYSDNFLLQLVTPWMNERHSSGWSINRIAENIQRVGNMAYLRREGDPFGLARVPPEYPADALRRREEGTVCLHFALDEQGHPNAIEVYSEDHPSSLEAPAIEAIEQFIYAPRMRNSTPVPTERVSFCFDFVLRNGG